MKKYLSLSIVLFVLGFSALHTAPAAQAAQTVSISEEAVGTIIVRTSQRRLYLVTAPGRALSYSVGVGRAGKQWAGQSYIVSKRLRPAWSPPDEIKRDRPS